MKTRLDASRKNLIKIFKTSQIIPPEIGLVVIILLKMNVFHLNEFHKQITGLLYVPRPINPLVCIAKGLVREGEGGRGADSPD